MSNFFSSMKSIFGIVSRASAEEPEKKEEGTESGLSETIDKVTDVAATAFPVIGMLKGVVETVMTISGDDEEKASAMYQEFGADLCEIAAKILRATKDGKVTKKEQEEILEQCRELMDNSK